MSNISRIAFSEALKHSMTHDPGIMQGKILLGLAAVVEAVEEHTELMKEISGYNHRKELQDKEEVHSDGKE